MSELSSTDPIDAEVGQRLRAFRLARNMSQIALGSAAGITFQQVQKYERAKNRISASMMCKLAEALQINPADLLPPALCGRPLEGVAGAYQNKSIVEALHLLSKLPPDRQSSALIIMRALAEG